jgi:hypothetical protein
MKVVSFGCGPWRWYKGVGKIHMNKGRVGEERRGKEMDGCPLTILTDPEYWHRLNQLIKTCKLLVDAIGNLESCDATLANCMLELQQFLKSLSHVTFFLFIQNSM